VSEALRGVAKEAPVPTSIEFGRLVDALAIGEPLEKALKEMSERNDLPEYGFFAAALSLQAQTGGGLAETLELLADVARKRVAMQARGFALSSEARTSSMILAGLPFVTGGALYLANPTYIGVLFTDPSGQMILGIAILSLCMGIFTMRMIIRSALTT
jgi:tight adherence protein B